MSLNPRPHQICQPSKELQEWVSSLPIACQCAPCCQRDWGSTLPLPLGPEGVCWSRRAYRVLRGKGLASALAYVPHCPKAAKSSRRLVLDAVNFTRWSFCFRRQTASSLPKMTQRGPQMLVPSLCQVSAIGGISDAPSPRSESVGNVS